TGGKRAPICVVYLLGTAVSIYAFWRATDPWMSGVSLFAVGFLVYGPQFLVGVMTADVVTRQGAATAIGLTGFFGYVSQVISGWGLGSLVDRYGWSLSFELLMVSAVLGAIPFVLCWRVGPTSEEAVLASLER
ncbi:MAG TPA: MFS transporter, partial [Candidatus Xenobia bacterium]